MQLREPNKSFYEFFHPIGKGGYGRVWKVQHKRTLKLFAIKVLSKPKIIDKQFERNIKFERDLLASLNSESYANNNYTAITKLYFAFQDHENLYMAFDLYSSGDLRYNIYKCKRFSETQASNWILILNLEFFAACIITGLEYLNMRGIVHRDLKPENIMFDCDGYPYIIDFGIANLYKSNVCRETSGTPGYMAPEVLKGLPHDCCADYFSFGIILYELLIGDRPYQSDSKNAYMQDLLSFQAKVPPHTGFSDSMVDFIDKVSNTNLS